MSKIKSSKKTWNKFLPNSFKWSQNNNKVFKSVDKAKTTINSNKYPINNLLHKLKDPSLLNKIKINLKVKFKAKIHINKNSIKNPLLMITLKSTMIFNLHNFLILKNKNSLINLISWNILKSKSKKIHPRHILIEKCLA